MVFFKQAGTPTEAFGDPDAFDTDVWLVKGVDKAASADTVEAIQARVAGSAERHDPFDQRRRAGIPAP